MLVFLFSVKSLRILLRIHLWIQTYGDGITTIHINQFHTAGTVGKSVQVGQEIVAKQFEQALLLMEKESENA